jgi:hypothetical protein
MTTSKEKLLTLASQNIAKASTYPKNHLFRELYLDIAAAHAIKAYHCDHTPLFTAAARIKHFIATNGAE